MEAFRKASKSDAEQAGTKMTPLVFLIKAVVAALKKYPKFNTSLSADGESLVQKHYFHIGVAVDTPNGLMVPVIRDADQKSLLDLAHDLTELSGKARDGKLSYDHRVIDGADAARFTQYLAHVLGDVRRLLL